MRLFKLPSVRLPSFGDFTAASVLAIGLWIATCGLMYRLDRAPDRFDAGALLLVLEWVCVSIRAGVEPRLGGRHLIANLTGCAALISAYALICGAIGG